MRSSPLLRYVACILLVLGATPRRGLADETVVTSEAEENRKAEAKERFLRGLEFARSEQNWDAALAEFLASHELFPTQVALLNAAISLTKLGRYPEALERYAQLLSVHGATMSAEDRALIEAETEELRNLVGEIDLTANEAGASVVVDGRERGTTPLREVLIVAPGTHSVRVTKPGFETVESSVLVASRQRRKLEIVLRRAGAGQDAKLLAERRPTPVVRQAIPNERHVYAAAALGGLLAPSFAGGAAEACGSSSECRDRDRPFGPLVACRFGYEVAQRLGLDLTLGFFQAREQLTRTVVAAGDLGRLYPASDYRDETKLSAIAAMLGLAYRAEWTLGLEARLGVGIVRGDVSHENQATFAISTVNPDNPSATYEGSQRVSIPEMSATLWIPAVAPELRLSYPISGFAQDTPGCPRT